MEQLLSVSSWADHRWWDVLQCNPSRCPRSKSLRVPPMLWRRIIDPFLLKKVPIGSMTAYATALAKNLTTVDRWPLIAGRVNSARLIRSVQIMYICCSIRRDPMSKCISISTYAPEFKMLSESGVSMMSWSGVRETDFAWPHPDFQTLCYLDFLKKGKKLPLLHLMYACVMIIRTKNYRPSKTMTSWKGSVSYSCRRTPNRN